MGVFLGVNIDHVATVRQARGGSDPSVLDAALICDNCAVSGITVHLREDRRHIQDKDVFEIKERVKTKLNLEMAMSDEIVAIALKVRPAMVTLVPEKRQEVTTEGGLDVVSNFERTKKVTDLMKSEGILVSLFVEPERSVVDYSLKTGADFIEFHTGTYSLQKYEAGIRRELDRLYSAAEHASQCGLGINAGHGLNYLNTPAILGMKNLHELNIGHSIISRAIFVGLEKAVEEMKSVLAKGVL